MKIQTGSLGLALGLGLATAATVLTGTGCVGERYARSSGTYIDDRSIVARVREALENNQDYKYDDVQVVSTNGSVQLSGFVDNDWLKYNATRIALKVPDVKYIDNHITIKSVAARSTGEYVDDQSLSERINSALVSNANYKFEEVNVSALEGSVRLSGFVNTPDQKNQARDIARQVAGVKDVVNNIAIKDKT